jgi:hypothetical protein
MIDLAGQRFGRLTVLQRGQNKGKVLAWLCRCDCGNEWEVITASLRNNSTRSCGCLASETTARRNMRHGHCGKAEFPVWRAMLWRCTNPKANQWMDYGGRGIEVRFQSFESFLAEIGPRPSRKHTVDRIDNEGHYEPGNVRWATKLVQGGYQRSNRLITWGGRTMHLAGWAREVGIAVETLCSRFRAGWSVERALTTPVRLRKAS